MDSDGDSGYFSSSSSQERPKRIPLPLPFSEDDVVNRVEFSTCGRPGVSLADWISHSDKRRSHLCLDDPEESLDELIADHRILYQCRWPGYDAHTCYVRMPAPVTQGVSALKKVDLLDVICKTLADWVLEMIRRKHIECTQPEWAIGLKNITFRHIYIVSVVELKGYTPKWVPVIEVDGKVLEQ
ncbi:hypothetical protein C8Q79DRAFT_1008743 [Trametes meyenii]|nr:hypothetical protein C8Q79DRAFT_1008743 [Trametes meyenii]